MLRTELTKKSFWNPLRFGQVVLNFVKPIAEGHLYQTSYHHIMRLLKLVSECGITKNTTALLWKSLMSGPSLNFSSRHDWNCQSQPQLNSISTLIEAEIVLFSVNATIHLATHPTTEKVVKWNKTSSTLIEDFKYLNLRLQIFQLKTSNTSKSTQTKLVIMTTVKTTFVSVIIVLHILTVTSLINQFGLN